MKFRSLRHAACVAGRGEAAVRGLHHSPRLATTNRAWDLAGAALLLCALLACGTRVDQVVYRYRLRLDSPATDGAAACWDWCISKSSALKGDCLEACPGVEVTSNEACQVDGRQPVGELCYTRVDVRKKLFVDEETVQALQAGAELAQATAEAAAMMDEIHDARSSHASNAPPPAAGPSEVGAQPSRAERPERTPATATPQRATHERSGREDTAGRLRPRGPMVGP